MVTSEVFSTLETHGRVQRPGNRIVLNSENAGWRSLHAAVFEEAPFDATETALGHPSLIYHIAHPTHVTRRIRSERRESALIGPRRICLTPGAAETRWQHSGRPEILQVYLREPVLRQALEDSFGGAADSVELVPRFAISDPLLEQLALALIAALGDGRADDTLYVDTTAAMIAVHLARRHSTQTRPERAVARDGLTARRLQRLFAYIDAHLGEDLRLARMAAAVELSPFYLARVFKARTGQSPHQYVLDRRIARARQLLRETNLPVAEVAAAAGFSSQSHLSSWFRRRVGVTPAAWRNAN